MAPRKVRGWTEPVQAVLLTVLAPRNSKIMLNVDTGDHAVLERRTCGCPLGRAGLDYHLHTIRSYDKLTSAGMHFAGADLLYLLEVALPSRFGGGPTDYQFVEDEVDGQTLVKLVISPLVGELDEPAVGAFAMQQLVDRTTGGRIMAEVWGDGQVLRIERARPYATSAAKIQALHVTQRRLAAQETERNPNAQ